MPDFIQQLHSYLFEPERLLSAIAAIIIVTVVGMVKGALGGNANPFFWHIIDLMFGRFGDKMNKVGRLRGDLIFRGFILTAVILALSFFLGKFLAALGAYYTTWSIIEILSLSLLLSSGAVLAGLGRLYRALNEKKVTPGAYFTIARSSRTDLTKNDDFTITRVAMGWALKTFDKGLVAPTIWFLIAGLPAAFLYAALAATSWRFGKEGHSSGFGDSMIALEKLMGYVPNVFSGILISLAGLFTPTAGMTRAFLGWGKTDHSAPYGEGGLPVTAAAYALNVNIGGTTADLNGAVIKRSWVGPKGATAQLDAKHLHRVTYIVFMAHLLFIVSLSAAMIWA